MGASRSRDRITKACATCGTSITRLASLDAPRWYCNRECYAKSSSRAESARAVNAARYPNGRATVECGQCGKKFSRHSSRVKASNFCSTRCRTDYRRSQGKKFVNSQGYVVVGVPADHPGAKRNGKYGQILEHRKVMQDLLGRALLPDENVHHLNGVRDDNRPENLELWTRSQPSGQRVEDKLQWARDFIQLYEGLSNDQEK